MDEEHEVTQSNQDVTLSNQGVAILSNKELRAKARRQLRGVWKQMILAVFIFTFITELPFTVASKAFDSAKNTFIKLRAKHSLERLNLLKPTFEELTEGEEPSKEADSTFTEYTKLLVGDWTSAEGVAAMKSITTMILLSILLFIIGFVISGPFLLGIASYYLKSVRGKDIAVKDIFCGFKRFLPALLLDFFMTLFIALWTLLLIIPGLVKSLGYSMAYLIMSDDPKIGSLEALSKSQAMMYGYKWKLFKLILSFAGWFILALLPVILLSDFEENLIGWLILDVLSLSAVGFFILIPYISLSLANFYEDLKKNQKETLTDGTGTNMEIGQNPG